MRPLFLLTLIFFISCNDNKKETEQKPVDSSQPEGRTPTHDTDTRRFRNVWTDRLNGRKYPLPDTIDGKPVSFYLNHPKVALLAKALYNQQFRPTDNDSTTLLLSYVTTNDSSIRPFYRWCLDFTISITDGALAEYPGSPALKYAIKFPSEFFDFMDRDPAGERYKRWVEIIAYSGLLDYSKKTSVIEKEITSKMEAHCNECVDTIRNRIKTFAKDITEELKRQELDVY